MLVTPLSSRLVKIALILAVGILGVIPLPALAVDKPDLVVISLSDPPAEVIPGASFPVTAVVKNQGLVATSLPPQSDNATKFFLIPAPNTSGLSKKNLKGLQIIKTPLAKDETDGQNTPVTVAVYTDTKIGTYLLMACADGFDFIDETDDSTDSNCRTNTTAPITVKAAPNYQVSAISITKAPNPLAQGATFTVRNTVVNVGSADADPKLATTTKYSFLATDGTNLHYDLKREPIKDSNPAQIATVPGLARAGASGDSFTEENNVTIKAGIPPGQYLLQACADPDRFVVEQDYGDNCKATTGQVVVVASPDLAVTSVSVQGAPLTINAGDAQSKRVVSITAGVANQGLAASPPGAILRATLVDATTKASVKNLGVKDKTFLVPALSPQGGSATVQSLTNANVTADTPAGKYLLVVCVDPDKLITEPLRSNNCLQDPDETQTITVIGGDASHVELQMTSVTDLSCSNGDCTRLIPGDKVTATATVTNTGTDPLVFSTAKPFLTTNLYFTKGGTLTAFKNLKVDGSVNITTPIDALGGTVTQQMTGQVYSDTVPGTYTFMVCVDTAKQFTETNETNNCALAKDATGNVISLGVTDKVPNLIVNGMGNPPASKQIGDSFPLLIQVKNAGLAPVPGAGILAALPKVFTRTKYNLLPIDPRTGKPDPLAPKKDLKGPANATIPPLDVNQPFNDLETLTIQLNTTLGEYFLEVCVDAEKSVTEGDESDNCRPSTSTIVVTGLPDYVVTDATVKGTSPIQVKRLGALIVGATVKNQGVGNALSNSLVRFFLVNDSDPNKAPIVKNLGVTPVTPALAVGKTATFSNVAVGVFGDTVLGTYNKLRACADATDLLRESATGPLGTAETNNCMDINAVIQVIP
jgi:hypothetical protein